MTTDVRPFVAVRASEIGHRHCNQDRCFVLDGGDNILLGLADGLGGHPRGEAAAQLLQDVCEGLFRNLNGRVEEPRDFLLRCVGKAHDAIRRFGQRQRPPVAPRTTAVLALICDGVAHWAHVGDSRLYFVRQGNLLSHTEDHAHVELIRQRDDQPPRPRASLTRCLGGVAEPPVTTCGPPTRLETGDALLLCSDGLWGQCKAEALLHLFVDGGRRLEERLPLLVTRVSQVPQSDNVSAVALQWLGMPEPAPETPPDAPQMSQ